MCVDDATRLAYPEVLPDEKGETCAAFLTRAVQWLESQGVRTERVMTDNGSGYRSHAFGRALEAAGARHLKTRPYTRERQGRALHPDLPTEVGLRSALPPIGGAPCRTDALDPILQSLAAPHGDRRPVAPAKAQRAGEQRACQRHLALTERQIQRRVPRSGGIPSMWPVPLWGMPTVDTPSTWTYHP